MDRRMQLHDIFIEILETKGQSESRVYFEPPEIVKLKYPCIIYTRSDINTRFANNKPYKHKVQYMVTVVDKSSESEITKKIIDLPLTSYDRSFKSDGLNHDVLVTYY